MLSSIESLLSPSKDPNNHIGLSYFKQRDKALLEQKAQQAAVNFSISVAVMGGPDSGKNTLLSTECQEIESHISKSLIKGIGIQIYTVGEHKVRVNYHVAPGNEMYVKLSAKFLTGLAASLLIFDVNDERGLDYLDDWLDYSCPKRSSNIPPKRYMIGNKIDTPGNRVILPHMGREFAEMNSLQYLETCAKDRPKVHALFQEIVISLVEMVIGSVKPLPQFDIQSISKTGRKSSFLSRLMRKDADESASTQSQIFKTNSLEVSTTDFLKPTSEQRPRRNSVLDLTSKVTSMEIGHDEVFYDYNFQKGVSVPRKVRVLQKLIQLKESPLINEGTLELDWM